jgi:hypothetical protein
MLKKKKAYIARCIARFVAGGISAHTKANARFNDNKF